MVTRSALVRLAKELAAELRSGIETGFSSRTRKMLEGSYSAAGELAALFIAEAGKSEPDDDLISACELLLERAIEELRYGVERGLEDALDAKERLTARLLDAGAAGKLDGPTLLMILKCFAGAKLEVDERLQELMHGILAEADESLEPQIEASSDPMGDLAVMLDDDVFEAQLQFESSAEALPADIRGRMVEAIVARAKGTLGEAVVGFLLSATPAIRQAAAAGLQKAAVRRGLSPLTLRRMIAMRNWVPAAERPRIDAAVTAARKAGVACAGWPASPGTVAGYASFLDGAGAQSLLVVAGDAKGAEADLCGVLGRTELGVRDAWVKRGMPGDEVAEMLLMADEEAGLQMIPLAYVREAIETFLGETVEAGRTPPFGLLDVAETAGLTQLNPGPTALEDRLEALIAAAGAGAGDPGFVARALAESGTWHKKLPVFESWFEDDAGVHRLIGARASAAAAEKALLDGPIGERRRRWADLLVRAAAGMRSAGADVWPAMAVVAREVLGSRPPGDIPFLGQIARRSIVAYRGLAVELLEMPHGQAKAGKRRGGKQRKR